MWCRFVVGVGGLCWGVGVLFWWLCGRFVDSYCVCRY